MLAGAGFRIVIIFLILAICKQYLIKSIGNSNCVRKIFEFSIVFLILSIFFFDILEDAPGYTIIEFSPLLFTKIPAEPVGNVSEIKIESLLIFSFSNRFNASFPKESLPIFDIKVTFDPVRLAAIA